MVEQRPFSDVRAVQVSAGPEAPAEARNWASWSDEYLTRDGADDLRIVVGELVSNAVQHAGLAPGDPIHLSAAVTKGRVTLTVRDGGRGIPADALSRGLPGPQETSGRGLHIVRQLTTRLLIDQAAGRVTVELPRRR
jgi:anti-sigma regulatory factor (Ser/Thr protein kinase)